MFGPLFITNLFNGNYQPSNEDIQAIAQQVWHKETDEDFSE